MTQPPSTTQPSRPLALALAGAALVVIVVGALCDERLFGDRPRSP